MAHGVDAGQRLKSADQNAARGAGRLSDDVQALVHSVNEIDISAAGRAEDNSSPFCFTPGRVGRQIVIPQIRLSFDDHARRFAMPQNTSQKAARQIDCRPFEKNV